MLRKYLIAISALLVALAGAAPAQATQPEGTGPDVHKVFVCKYVGTPGDDEVLQTGNNPISVDTNALKDFPDSDNPFPWWFNDAQGRSVAIAWDEVQGDGQNNEPDVTLADCPRPDNPPPPVDLCKNLEGDQATVPEGYTEEDGVCTPVVDDKKIEICHRDQGNPEWKVIEISENALDAHLAHQWGEDIYPVPADGCSPPPPPPDEVYLCIGFAMAGPYAVDSDEAATYPVYDEETCVTGGVESTSYLCHFVSDDDGWVKVNVTETEALDHQDHPDDVIPAPVGGCPVVVSDTKSAPPATPAKAEAQFTG